MIFMKNSLLPSRVLTLLLVLCSTWAVAQLRITMVHPSNHAIRIKNFNPAPIDISSYRLCALFEYTSLNSSNVTIISGDFLLTQNEEVVVAWDALTGFNATASDLGLYLPTGSFGSAANMVDFMQYGAGGQGRENVAVAAGLWTAGTFLQAGSGPWIFTGNGTQSGITFWVSATEITFKVNMALQSVSANGVHIAGSFQGWSPGTSLMTDLDNNDIYEYTTFLAAGTQIQFKYVNGNAWGSDEAVPGACGQPNGFGGFNRFATIAASGSQILGPVCFTLCENCVTEGCMDPAACNFDALATINNVGLCTYPGCQDPNAFNYDVNAGCADTCIFTNANVTFKVNMANEMVSSNGVYLAGDIQGWDPSSTMMTDIDNDGIFEVTLPAVIGQSYQFKFINGSDWIFSEQVPVSCSVNDGSGNFNRELTVTQENFVFGPVCFGACLDCSDIVFGCTDINACNYNDLANTSNNSCNYPGCTDSLAFNYNPDAGCTDTCIYTDITITFKVNMANEIVSTNGVHFASNLQNWDPAATPMSDDDGDGVYEVTLPAASNQTYAFKFINGNDWAFSEFVPLNCGTDDGFGNINRIIATGDSNTVFGPVCFGNCVNCSDIVFGCNDIFACNFDSLVTNFDGTCVYPGCLDSVAFNYNPDAGCQGICIYPDINITFKVNMANEIVSPNGVHLAGSIQGWNPSTTEMNDLDGDGIYEVTLGTIANQTYQFKFINGNDWAEEEAVPANCGIANGVGSFDREISIDTSDVIFGPVCFGACIDCGGIIFGCTDMNACNYNPLANTSDNDCIYPGCLDSLAFNYSPNAGCSDTCLYADITVTFKVNMTNESISPDGVHLAGSIQGWNPATTEMTDGDGDGIYEVTLAAAAGQAYQFKFINGIDWPFAEQVPAECGLDDGFGGFNRSILVGGSNYIFGPVCFGACLNCGPGCLDNTACNFDSTAGISDSSLCIYPGCTDPVACNYSPTAGCLLELSCNYDVVSNEEYTANDNGFFSYNGSDLAPGNYTYTYVASNGCDSVVYVTIINPQLEGCGNPTACNYNPIAGINIDSLCVLPGCLETNACNYDPNALCGGGLCYYDEEVSFTQVFSEPFVFNDSLITVPGIYEFQTQTTYGCDSLIHLVVLDPTITDCFDSSACNYNPLAGIIANFLCTYPGCLDAAACNFDATAGCANNSCLYPGCIVSDACNFNASAGCDDGSCTFPGCTVVNACNYDSNAGCDDGSCGELIGSLCDDGDSLTVGDSIALGCACIGDSAAIAIHEILANEILVYPNPTNDKIFIQMDGITTANMQLIGITGEIVFRGKAMHELSVNDLPAGIYLLQLERNGITASRRIEIIR